MGMCGYMKPGNWEDFLERSKSRRDGDIPVFFFDRIIGVACARTSRITQ